MDPQADPHSTLVAQFTMGPAQLKQALQGLSESELDLREGEGWSIRQIVHHLADAEDLWRPFIRQALGCQPAPFVMDWFFQIPQAEWANAWHSAGRAIGPSLDLLDASRAFIVELVEAVPGALEMSLAVRLPGGGEERGQVSDIIALQTRHISEHIAEIRRILAKGKPEEDLR